MKKMKFPWSHGLRSQQGQDIIEYSLMLAIIVGVGGMLINHENVAGHISHIFTSAGELMDRISPRDADLPSIDTSGMTDAQKQDKGVPDAITRAMEEAIRKGDILFDDGATANLSFHDNSDFARLLRERGVVDRSSSVTYYDGTVVRGDGQNGNHNSDGGQRNTGIRWSDAGLAGSTWTNTSAPYVNVTDLWGTVRKYNAAGLNDIIRHDSSSTYTISIQKTGSSSYTTTYYRNGSAIGSVNWTK